MSTEQNSSPAASGHALAFEAFNQINSLARTMLCAMESPAFWRSAETLARALEAISMVAEDAANVIDCESEEAGVKLASTTAARRARWEAARLAAGN